MLQFSQLPRPLADDKRANCAANNIINGEKEGVKVLAWKGKAGPAQKGEHEGVGGGVRRRYKVHDTRCEDGGSRRLEGRIWGSGRKGVDDVT